jgi:alkaline phosphatase D
VIQSGLRPSPSPPIGRRTVLKAAAAAMSTTALGRIAHAAPEPLPRATPFTLGVASGDPAADGFVIWTRLVPEPLDGGGMPPEPVPVEWEVADDERWKRIVRRGVAIARPEWGHSVHVELRGLSPDRWYWYRFRTRKDISPVGRTRTTPPMGAPLARVRFAFASCQHWEQGYFAAYRHMLDDPLDFVIHLGDYIYETSSWADEVRRHEGPEPVTLEEYRARHALYKLDPDLQRAHMAWPWLVTWDDHEVDNDYAADQSQDRDPPDAFLRRRAAAYQAYWEHMPLRHSARPRGPSMRLYQSGTPRRRADDARPRSGTLALHGSRAITRALERRRPAAAHGRAETAHTGRR